LGPPWPQDDIRVAVWTTVVELLVFMVAYSVLSVFSNRLRWWQLVSMTSLLLASLTYVVLDTRFVIQCNSSRLDRRVVGTTLLPAAVKLQNDPKTKTESVEELVANFSCDPDMVFAPGPLMLRRRALLVSWFLLFMNVGFVAAVFVAQFARRS
jgi:hypothetical protein